MKLVLTFDNSPTDGEALRSLFSSLGEQLQEDVGVFAITTDRFNLDDEDLGNETEIGAAREAAYSFFRSVNGILQLEPGPVRRIGLRDVLYEDADGKRHGLPPRAPTGLRVTLSTDDPLSIQKEFLRAAVSYPAAASLLRHIEAGLSWVNMYKIYEIVMEDLGGDDQIVAAGWVSARDIRRFKASANNTSVTGDDSRHGKLASGTPADTMTLGEALHIIPDLARRWLREHVPLLL